MQVHAAARPDLQLNASHGDESDGRMVVGYLTGTPYCGSTLMAMLMDCHPAIATTGECAPNVRVRRNRRGTIIPCSCGQPLADCRFWKFVVEDIERRGGSFALGDWPNDMRYMQPMLNRLLTGYSDRHWVQAGRAAADRWLPLHRRRLQRARGISVEVMRSALNYKQASVYFDTSKDLERLSHLTAIAELDVRVVIVVKDVRAFAASMKKRGASARQAVAIWQRNMQATETFLERRSDLPRIVVRHQDFCRDVAGQAARVCDLLGVDAFPIPDEIDPQDHHVIGNKLRLKGRLRIQSQDDWKGCLSADEEDVVLQIAGDMNDRFGFAR